MGWQRVHRSMKMRSTHCSWNPLWLRKLTRYCSSPSWSIGGPREAICTLAQSGWPVTGQLLLSSWLVSRSDTGAASRCALSSSGAGWYCVHCTSSRSRLRPSSSCIGSCANRSGPSSVTPTLPALAAPRQTAALTSARMRACTCAASAKRGVEKGGVGKAVEVELEGLALHDPGRLAGHGDMGQRHLRLAALIEPGQLERRPQVGPEKGRRAADAKRGPLVRARYRKQQRGVVLVGTGG